MAHMTIEGWSETIPLQSGSLLDAAIEAGVPVPYQCRVGECGMCKCRVLSGQVRSKPHLADALSEREVAQGWILPCRSSSVRDLTIAFPKALRRARPRMQRMHARIQAIAPETPEVLRLVLRTDQPLGFVAGQYVTLRIEGGPERNYSPANSPGGRELEFFIRAVPGGAVSGYLAEEARIDDPVQISGPYGSACLDDLPDRPLILAAGGAGLSPILSILRALEHMQPTLPIWLYAGARCAQEEIARTELARLSSVIPQLRVVRVLSHDAAEGARFGWIGPAIADDHTDLAPCDVFIAGPPPMVTHVEDAVLALGANPGRIQSDPFLAAAPPSGLARLTSWLRRRAG